ncbi:MAG: ABC transporter permease [Actinobacteria bacterium]|nr:ABC transporter permease [Actinomycetota bacterium]
MRPVLLLVRKDLRILRRSPVLLGTLVAYPLVIALLVGLVAGYASAKPRVALVDEAGLPHTITLAGETFNVDKTIRNVSESVKLVGLSRDEAERELRNGEVVAVITVPQDFLSNLRGMLHSPQLQVQTGTGTLASRVKQQIQALVYSLNRQLQGAFIRTNLGYVHALKHGATISFLGRKIEILGLDKSEELLAQLPPSSQRDRVIAFVHDARLALAQTDAAMRATANPIQLVEVSKRGRTWALSAQVQSYALAVTIAFLTLLLAASALAAERDENVIGRLARGLVGFGQLVWAKVALAAAVALGLGAGIALVFGIIIQAAGIEGGEPWERLPLLLAGVALAGASLGALGALIGGLAREARTASLVAVLIVLPIVFLGLVPKEVVPAAAWISEAFPFSHAARLFQSALFDSSPWSGTGREALWLLGLGGGFGLLARVAARRLLA